MDDSAGNPDYDPRASNPHVDEANFIRHIAGPYDRVLGQLCSRCGAVLDVGHGLRIAGVPVGRAGGFVPGEAVLVSQGGGFLAVESNLKADRDRSDEADCESVL